ncbi:eukaryotic mitochondrial regulator protein-domain-containing protein [Radiomyces spectabilis]|uniref:eukaryotic mitochondrial regulator protein-domain-containing protein n=1 Tax=Radiomyces spectabilis TaxID=64574 RepID=UPI00221E636B|nr:eukaryotic mitochondrial regulator protein-domain-containing protein [Radiomyces spectabilis]KAI8390995.1 eukaryotic mitochondrial regulator protein-domain-containing protein [Radiomyces spectabilis]
MLRPSTRLISSIRLAATPAANATLRCQRNFSWSVQRLAEEPPKATEEATVEPTAEATEEAAEEVEPIKLSRRRRKFHAWVQKEGSTFARPSQGGANYLDETPFPNNKLFKPRPPLSDARREEIYNTYISDPEQWTIRQLATKFSLSLKRVEAILKLKAAEKEMEQNGVVLQRKFTKAMEQYMGTDHAIQNLEEPLIDLFPRINKPRFEILEEDAPFTPEDAAKVLNRKPYKLLEKEAIESEQAHFELPSKSNNQANVAAGKRHKFVIVDTSS